MQALPPAHKCSVTDNVTIESRNELRLWWHNMSVYQRGTNARPDETMAARG